ncbi:MAG: lipopolysaccharide heptosyltransferase II [Gammaproteobacteria bacterium]
MSPKRILIAGPNWIGDLVMADTLLKLLRQAEPETSIDLLAPAWVLPLAERMAEVTTAIEIPGGHGELAFGARRRLARELRKNGYTQAYVLPRSAKAALLPWLARIPVRTGYRGEARYGLLNDMRRVNPSHHAVAERYAALAFTPGAELPASLPRPELLSDVAARTATLTRLGLRAEAGAVALAPGAEYGPAKRWPIAYFTELAARLIAEGQPVWVLGSVRERPLGEAIRARVSDVRNLAGETSLIEAVDVLAAATAAVVNDSGLMHVAAAVGTPLVAIYGSSSPCYTPPASERAEVIYLALPCSPCFARECPLGHLNCLRAIGVGGVYAAVNRQIGAPARSAV